MVEKVEIQLPYLQVVGPNGENFRVVIPTEHFSIGRFSGVNDLALPDPEQLISRRCHCLVEKVDRTWFVVDNGSINGTFVRRTPTAPLEAVRGRAPLFEGHAICLLGKLTEDGKHPLWYWELTFSDPLATHGPQIGSPSLCYDRLMGRLTRTNGYETSYEEIELRPQEQKLIRYMSHRNQMNNRVPIICSHEELIEAVWGGQAGIQRKDVNHLVLSLRRKIEWDSREPKFLKSVRGLGYRLEINESE